MPFWNLPDWITQTDTSARGQLSGGRDARGLRILWPRQLEGRTGEPDWSWFTFSSFLQAIASMGRNWRISRWLRFFKQLLFFFAPSLVCFIRLIFVRSLLLDFLCENSAKPIAQDHCLVLIAVSAAWPVLKINLQSPHSLFQSSAHFLKSPNWVLVWESGHSNRSGRLGFETLLGPPTLHSYKLPLHPFLQVSITGLFSKAS